MHRLGVHFDRDTSSVLKLRYHKKLDKESAKLAELIQEVMSNADAITVSKAPFKSAKDFNPSSTPQVKYLLTDLMRLEVDSSDKSVLKKLNLPITNQLLKVRSLGTLIGSFVDKLPDATGADGRVHSTFKSIGADTGRMSSADPNVQNIPSHALDIRHQFRATPAMEKIDDCTETEQGIEVTLGSYDVVRLSDHTEKEVIDLVVGDIVILLNNNKEVNAIVKSISNMAPDTRLCLDVI